MFKQFESIDKASAADAAKTASFFDIDCTANPHDLRPAIAAVMAAESALLQKLEPEQRLVVLLGEFHEFQAHKVLQKALLMEHVSQAKTHPDRSFAMGYEGAHNFKMEVADINDEDPDGRIAMDLFCSGKIDVSERNGSCEVFDYCRKQNISVAFNDVAVAFNAHEVALLDQNDPFTGGLVKRHRPHLAGKKIYRESLPWASSDVNGMALSNLAMVENAMAHMERTKAKIYIQLCGSNHIAGDKDDRIPFKDSLSAQFEARGFTILPVMPTFEWLKHTIEDEAATTLEKAVKISNIERARAPRSNYQDLRAKMIAESHLTF